MGVAAGAGVAEVAARALAEGSRPRAAGLAQAAELVRAVRAPDQPVGRLPLGQRVGRLLRRDLRQRVPLPGKAQLGQVAPPPGNAQRRAQA